MCQHLDANESDPSGTYGRNVVVAKPQKNEHVRSGSLIEGIGKLWVHAIFYQSNKSGSSHRGTFTMDWEEGSC